MNVLFSFDSLISVDTGIIKCLHDNYYNDIIFDSDKLTRMNNEEKYMIYNLMYRSNINPISIIMKKDSKLDPNKLYNELLGKFLKSVLSYTTESPLLEFANKCILNNNTNVTIWCRQDREADFIKTKLPNVNTIKSARVDASDYDAIYLDKYIDTLCFNNLIAKNVYIYEARYNMENDGKTPSIDISVKINTANKINIMNIYYLSKPK